MESYTCNNNMGSFQKWFIGNYVRAILLDEPEIVKQVGRNIYPLIAPENTDGDFILYERDSYSKEKDLHSIVYRDICKVALTAVSDNYDSSVKLASLIDNTLTGKHITDEGCRFDCLLSDSTEQFTDGKYIQVLIYTIN